VSFAILRRLEVLGVEAVLYKARVVSNEWLCLVCLLGWVRADICDVGVFKLFKLCTGGVRKDELWGGGGLVIDLLFCLRDVVGGGGGCGPWLRRVCFDGCSDIL